MADLWNNLLASLDLRVSPPPGGTAETEGVIAPDTATGTTVPGGPPTAFEGPNLPLNYRRLFGGQILGQFVRAAELACPDKQVKSVHTLFAREGSYDEPVRYEVSSQHQGRSFATLSILARQSTRVVASAAVSMHVAEDGPQAQHVEDVAAVLAPEYRVTFDLLPWETRAFDDLNSTAAALPEYEFWMRTPTVDPELAPALTAYATDLNLIGTALRPFDGVSQRGNGTAFTSAVTAHTLWFHRPFRTDDWLLLRQHSPLLAHGRSFGRGDVLTATGELVASFAQEALVRFDSEVAQSVSAPAATARSAVPRG
ncbi:thioesterase family protein [Nocardia sp. PE-7]|uniref:acyl-CoA thioesterase n=1 Tax=Nocardia sp. PE-7 TaxID=3058426 RepID=UPI002659C0DE|nr:acyl-CoA thioesterase domain-containing protein [Nocardia sp. PE-7]WKG12995.1 thioesterase family protein [Nocardia sp. PE-7]